MPREDEPSDEPSSSSPRYTVPPTEHFTNAMTFLVSVPVLSDNTHRTCPSSSLSVVVRTPHDTPASRS